jgi:hypothetical protein
MKKKREEKDGKRVVGGREKGKKETKGVRGEYGIQRRGAEVITCTVSVSISISFSIFISMCNWLHACILSTLLQGRDEMK